LRKIFALALAAIVIVACGQAPAPHRSASPAATDARPGAPAAVSPPAGRALPSRLLIPSIGLSADLESVGVDANGNLGVPSNPARAAWYQGGPAPGEPGDAVIDGHLDWTTGPAVFWNLEQLRAGDEIDVVAQSGDQLRFVVADAAHYPYDSHPPQLFSGEGPARLSLITCAGSWDRGRRTYLERLIVDADYVEVPLLLR
jgi:sortase (surface protein transpeptidase)